MIRNVILIISILVIFFDFSFANIKNNIVLKVENEIVTNYEIKNKILSSLILSNQLVNQENINKTKQLNSKKNNKENSLKYIFNYFIVILILFISIILVVDTFKTQISYILPGIIPLLDNLYATLYDLKLFIKDLFN